MDRPSLRFLAYALRRAEGMPILFAAGLRSAEAGTDPALVAELVHDPATVQVHPGPLSLDAIAGARRWTCSAPHPSASSPRPATRPRGGNPLLLRQLLTALAAEGIRPEAAQAQVVREIGPRAVSRTVDAAARAAVGRRARGRAVGRPCSARTPRSTPSPGSRRSTRWPRRARPASSRRAEILRHGTPLGFVHPLVRDAVYRELPPGERELQHDRAARMLNDAGAPPEQVAAHLLMTSPRGEEWVADLLQEAGRAAFRRGASDSAPTYLRRALREPAPAAHTPQLLLELGLAEIMTDGAAALEHLRMAYDGLSDPVAKAIAAGALGRILMFQNEPEAAAELARRTRGREVPAEMPRTCATASRPSSWPRYFFMDDLDRAALAGSEHSEAAGPDAPVGEKMLAAVAAADWTWRGGSADEVSELALAALSGGDLMRADNALLTIAAIRPARRRRPRGGHGRPGSSRLAEAHRRGSVFELAGLHLWYGFTQYWRGELSDAEATLRTAFDELQALGLRQDRGLVLRRLSGGHAHLARRRRRRRARRWSARGDPGDSSADGARMWRHSEVARAARRGPLRGGARQGRRLRPRLARQRNPNPADAPWRTFKAFALHKLGRDEEAEAVALEELEFARAWGSPGTVGRVLRTLGRTRGEAGIADIEQAIEILEPSTARLEHARAVAALGTALRRFGRPTDAREPLRRALELASAVRRHAARRGGPRGAPGRGRAARARTPPPGIESLTPSERRVVDLAVGGGTNRDIAQELYVTPKTVEVHLSNAYRKLGIRGRRELPQAIAA